MANKFQTGFDQPLLHTMYVDKKVGGVNAVQTLSRLNRTAAGKKDTFVLDFVNSADEIKKSFDPFFETTILGEATDPNKLFDLQSSLDAFQVYTPEQVQDFSQKIVTNIPIDQLHSILDVASEVFRTTLTEEQQDDFRGKCKSYVRLYVFLAQLVPFVKELAKPTQIKIVFKKFSDPLKKIKNATHSRHSMTRQLNNDNGLQARWTERQMVTAPLPRLRRGRGKYVNQL